MKHIHYALAALLLLSCPRFATAQAGMVNTERAFAATAARSGVARAFMANLDTAGVLFNQGKAINGIALFKNDTSTTKGLTWYPVHWLTSVSGDIGFTTGPFIQEAPGRSTVQHGQFSSIWKKNEQQQWKLVVDMGCQLPLATTVRKGGVPAVLQPSSMTEAAILKIEDDFNRNYASGGISAFDPVITDYSWLNLEHHGVANNRKTILALLRKAPSTLEFKPIKTALSSGKDLFYAWGDLLTANGTSNYLRVWGHTADGWKILLQVILLPSGPVQ